MHLRKIDTDGSLAFYSMLCAQLILTPLLEFVDRRSFISNSGSRQVTQYLLDKALIMDEDTLYDLSLKIEPRLPA